MPHFYLFFIILNLPKVPNKLFNHACMYLLRVINNNSTIRPFHPSFIFLKTLVSDQLDQSYYYK